MFTQSDSILYSHNKKPPTNILIAVAVQHLVILLGSLIAVIEFSGNFSPLMRMSIISITMIASGISTILLSLSHRVLGTGYQMYQGASLIYVDPARAFGSNLPFVYGMLFFSSVVQIILSRFLRKMHRFFPPEVNGMVILSVGFSLISEAATNFVGTIHHTEPYLGMPELLVANASLFTMVALNVWGNNNVKIYSLIAGITVGYILALALGVVNSTHFEMIESAAAFSIPKLNLPKWSFSSEHILPFLVCSLAVTLKGAGDITALQKISNENWKRPNLRQVSKGALASGLGNLISSILGGFGQATSSANIGYGAATGVLSRHVAFVTGAAIMLMAFFPKVILFITYIPKPVMGAAMIFLISFLIITGIQIIVSRLLDARKIFVIGISLVFGLSVEMQGDLYANIHPILQPIFKSSVSVTTLLAIFLNLIFSIGIHDEKEMNLKASRVSTNKIVRFLNRQGALWGARKEVIHNAVGAVTELFDSLYYLKLKDSKVHIFIKYDYVNLVIEATYQGRALAKTGQLQSGKSLMQSKDSVSLSTYMMQHYADRIRYTELKGKQKIRLYFEL